MEEKKKGGKRAAPGMKGVRIRRLMKRSALPSQANFDKYRHIRPKKLFRKGAVPTRECAAPLTGEALRSTASALSLGANAHSVRLQSMRPSRHMGP